MPRVSLYNMQGETVGEVDLVDEVFDVTAHPDLLHQVVTVYLANQRVGTAATKTRSLVRGGGRKPWRQKGTGRARQGSIRAPHWKGGATVFGPQPRDYRQALPRQARRTALKGALSEKVRTGAIRVLDRLSFPAPRTKGMAAVLKSLGIDGKKALVVTASPDGNVYKSARNLPGVETVNAPDLNVYQVLHTNNLVFTREAVDRVQEALRR